MVDVSKIPLPEVAHVPGKNARPDPALLEDICNRADPLTTDATSANNLPWIYGIRLFNNGFYWEAHEVWETVWMKAPPNSREKHFVQGMIHFTNGLLKTWMERPGAACRLFDLAEESIANAIPLHDRAQCDQFMFVNTARLEACLRLARLPGIGDECVNSKKNEL